MISCNQLNQLGNKLLEYGYPLVFGVAEEVGCTGRDCDAWYFEGVQLLRQLCDDFSQKHRSITQEGMTKFFEIVHDRLYVRACAMRKEMRTHWEDERCFMGY